MPDAQPAMIEIVPGRRDRGHLGVADCHSVVLCVPQTAFPHGECAASFSELLAGRPSGIANELTNAPGQFEGIFRVVGNSKQKQQIRKPHHPEPDLSGQMRGVVNLLSWILVRLHDIVEESHGKLDRLSQVLPIDRIPPAALSALCVKNAAKLMEPRLQASWGRSGCSPQGLVARMGPRWGVGLCRVISSMNTSPGSPVCQAQSTIRLQTSSDGQVAIADHLRLSFVRDFTRFSAQIAPFARVRVQNYVGRVGLRLDCLHETRR